MIYPRATFLSKIEASKLTLSILMEGGRKISPGKRKDGNYHGAITAHLKVGLKKPK